MLLDSLADRGIKQLLKSQVNLEFLRLKAPANAERSFSDAAISMLKSPCLRVVILKGCDNLTSSGVATLVKNCPNIQHLSLVRCTKIGDEAIQQCANILRHHLVSTSYPSHIINGIVYCYGFWILC